MVHVLSKFLISSFFLLQMNIRRETDKDLHLRKHSSHASITLYCLGFRINENYITFCVMQLKTRRAAYFKYHSEQSVSPSE